MYKTPPKKKQSKREANSPAKTDLKPAQAKSSYIGEKVTASNIKRVKKYQFAPVNNLAGSSDKILRPISVAQIRNTARPKNSLPTELKPVVLSSRPIKLSTTPKKVGRIPRKEIRQINENGLLPSQEVIWNYSPQNKDDSLGKLPSSQEFSTNNVSVHEHDVSSTPIVPKSLKSVISFSNIDDKIQFEQNIDHCDKNEFGKDMKSEMITGSKSSVRDIDDILGDIERDAKNSSPLRIPSSPTDNIRKVRNIEHSNKNHVIDLNKQQAKLKSDTKAQQTKIPLHKSDAVTLPESKTFLQINLKTDNNESDYSDDNDDSLIELLTQKSVEKTTEKHELAMIDHAQLDEISEGGVQLAESSDDILDYLEQKPDERMNEKKSEASNDSDTLSESATPKHALSPEKLENYKKLAKCSFSKKGVTRYVIINYNDLNNPKFGRQKVLSCVNAEGEIDSIMVRHPWVYLDFEIGDVIHIIEGANATNKKLLSDNVDPNTQVKNDNLLILNPDLLFSATTVGSSIECLRRAVIQKSFQDSRGEPSEVMTLGTVVHELIQNSLKHKLNYGLANLELLDNMLDGILEVHKFDVMVCNSTIAAFRKKIREEHVPNILEFLNRFVKDDNFGCYISVSGSKKKKPVSISNIFDIEENIMSPVFGLKGFLDVTVEAHIDNRRVMMPLEVKTGKMRSISHEAQGLVYTLLLKDKYGLNIENFLLYHSRYNDLTSYDKSLHSIKHILMFRNQMSNKFKHQLRDETIPHTENLTLPPILSSSICDRCFCKTMCMVLNKLAENGIASESGLKNGEYEQLTNQLLKNLPNYQKFFNKYNQLITMEETGISKIPSELFLFDAETKENLGGHCISNLSVSDFFEIDREDEKFSYTFERNNGTNKSFFESHLSLGDYVFISDEQGHFGLARGKITSITSSSVKILTRRRLITNTQNSKANTGTIIRSVFDRKLNKKSIIAMQNTVTYRIDKNELEQGLALARYNLLNLFLPDIKEGEIITNDYTHESRAAKLSDGGDSRTRSLLVDGKSPLFRSVNDDPVIPYEVDAKLNFNSNQLSAIDKVMRAKNCAMILGMPGTGKTTVITEIIRNIVNAGKTVLLTSYTHSAVDNILMKLGESIENIMRLGSSQKIHPKVARYIPNYNAVDTYQDYLKKINSTSVVATTCLGIGDIMLTLKEKDFDYVILDEASQVSLPVALGPLRFGKKFIMVGDHYQLPPLVKNRSAKLGGLEISPFQLLCEKFPEAVVTLSIQYRMCSEIMALSNFLIYNNKLTCGNESVASQTLVIDNLNELSKYRKQGDCWLSEVFQPENKVMFLDYDKATDIEEKLERDHCMNTGEVKLTYDCVQGMVECGVKLEKIGVMTLYRGQLNLLKKKFSHHISKGLEILTADQFQGRDKDCIIISLVRRNQINGSSLLREIRRVNVAMTRAKSKLIIIGSKSTFQNVTEMKEFTSFIESKNWMYDLPSTCLQTYEFPSFEGLSEYSTTRRRLKTINSDSKILKSKPIVKQLLNDL